MQKNAAGIRIPLIVKLTAIYTALTLCVIAITGATVYYGVAWYISDNAEKAVAASRTAISGYINNGGAVDEKLMTGELLQPDVLLIVTDSAGNLVLCGNADGIRGLPPRYQQITHMWRKQQPLVGNRAPLRQPLSGNNKDYYLDQLKLAVRDQDLTLTFVRPLDGERSLLKVLVAALMAVGFTALLLSLAASYWLSRRVLAPIKKLTEATRLISVDRLEQQVSVSGIDDELQELARNFNTMIVRLQRGVESEKRFVSDASHELRTPLTIISGYADMLDRWGRENPETLSEGLQAIKTETARMKTLVEKLLELAQTDKAVISKQPLALEPLLAGIINDYRGVDARHNYQLVMNPELVVPGDEALLRQLLRIILDNSSKYTPGGGAITIAATASSVDCVITVTDNGSGISAEDLPRVFDRFYRSDRARNSQTGGLGIGLALAKRITELHGGQIALHSENGRGTVVTIHLPLS